MECYIDRLKDSVAFQRWNDGNTLFPYDDPLIMFHGTTGDFNCFSNFSLDLRIYRVVNRMTNGQSAIFGTFFSASPRVAQNFTKKKWWIRNSKYKEGAGIRPCIVKLTNPHFLYPVQATYFNRIHRLEDHGAVYTDFIARMKEYGHDGIIIYKEFDGAKWWTGGKNDKVISGTESEYSAIQVCVFDPSFDNILQLSDLQLFI